jgi:flagellum-specific peptidoglycan hydrolase FlgJ
VLLLALAVREVPVAAPQDGGVLGLSHRGPGAQIRARIDRVHRLAETAPDEAAALGDELLLDLQDQRGLDGPLTEETRDVLARELIGVRAQLAVAGMRGISGFRSDFVTSVSEGASWADYLTGVPASITVAQAILESDWGRSAPGHNLFGLKGEGPEGSTLRKVVEYRHGRRSVRSARFRAYASFDGSLLDHASILSRSRHYAAARRVADDPPRYARALQGTYATDPHYAEKLVGLIDRYDLSRLDWSAPSPWRE